MKTLLFILNMFLCLTVVGQNEFDFSVLEECLTNHLKVFPGHNDYETADSILIYVNQKTRINYFKNNILSSIDNRPVVLLTKKSLKKRLGEKSNYTVYYISVHELDKLRQIIYIATMSAKRYRHILYIGNVEENSQYLIYNGHIKQITINGEILYQE